MDLNASVVTAVEDTIHKKIIKEERFE